MGRDEFDYDGARRELLEEVGVQLVGGFELCISRRGARARNSGPFLVRKSESAVRSIIHRHLEKDRRRKERECETAPFLDDFSPILQQSRKPAVVGILGKQADNLRDRASGPVERNLK